VHARAIHVRQLAVSQQAARTPVSATRLRDAWMRRSTCHNVASNAFHSADAVRYPDCGRRLRHCCCCSQAPGVQKARSRFQVINRCAHVRCGAVRFVNTTIANHTLSVVDDRRSIAFWASTRRQCGDSWGKTGKHGSSARRAVIDLTAN